MAAAKTIEANGRERWVNEDFRGSSFYLKKLFLKAIFRKSERCERCFRETFYLKPEKDLNFYTDDRCVIKTNDFKDLRITQESLIFDGAAVGFWVSKKEFAENIVRIARLSVLTLYYLGLKVERHPLTNIVRTSFASFNPQNQRGDPVMTLTDPELYDVRTERVEMETDGPYGAFADPSVPLPPLDNPQSLLSPMVAVHAALASCMPGAQQHRVTAFNTGRKWKHPRPTPMPPLNIRTVRKKVDRLKVVVREHQPDFAPYLSVLDADVRALERLFLTTTKPSGTAILRARNLCRCSLLRLACLAVGVRHGSIVLYKSDQVGVVRFPPVRKMLEMPRITATAMSVEGGALDAPGVWQRIYAVAKRQGKLDHYGYMRGTYEQLIKPLRWHTTNSVSMGVRGVMANLVGFGADATLPLETRMLLGPDCAWDVVEAMARTHPPKHLL